MNTTISRVLAFCVLLCLSIATYSPIATRSAELSFAFNSKKQKASSGNLAPSITASLTDSLPDPNGNGKVSRGEEITYTATLINNGTTAAFNTSIDFPLDSNLTFVPNSTIVTRRIMPAVASTNPVNGAVNVPRSSAITVTFNRSVNATVNSFALECPSATPQAFSVSGSGTTIITLTPSQSLPGNTNCTVRVIATEIRSTTFNDQMAADYLFGFTTAPISAQLRITEVAPNIGSSRDLVELLVIQGGNVGNMTLVQDRTITLATLPNVDVATGDVIVVHLVPDVSGGLNGDAPASETLSKNQYTAAMYSSNYDNAWDFHGGTTGITYSSRILRINGPDGVTQDGVPFSRTSGTPPSLFPTELQALQTEGLWLPANCGGAPCTTTSTPTAIQVSVSWEGVTTTRATTVRRVSSNDTNTNSDWAVGANTLGAVNSFAAFAGNSSEKGLMAKTSNEDGSEAKIFAPAVAVSIGDISPGEIVVVTFRAVVDINTPSSVTEVSVQGTITGDNINALVTDDPSVGGADDATVTQLSALPTAASVTLSGRVLDINRRGLSKVQVVLTDTGGNSRSVLTNPFGYYRFPDVAAGQTVILQPVHKRLIFAPQALTVAEETSDLNFIAAP